MFNLLALQCSYIIGSCPFLEGYYVLVRDMIEMSVGIGYDRAKAKPNEAEKGVVS
jgi:hypothetical protein